MLFDPRWEQKTKADPFALESLIAWLETRNPSEPYDWCKFQQCLLGQWARTMDASAYTPGPPVVPNGYHYYVHGRLVDLSSFMDIVVPRPWTFGAALERARAVLLAE